VTNALAYNGTELITQMKYCPYPQTLEKAAKEKHSSLIWKIIKYGKNFYNLDPGLNVIKLYAPVIYGFL
jgi:hypothetical protein